MEQTVKETRVANGKRLIGNYGTKAAFAEAIDREPSVVSQMAAGRLGDRLCRHIEKMLQLPTGYMDTHHEDGGHSQFEYHLQQLQALYDQRALTPEEHRLISLYRALPDKKQKAVIQVAVNMAN